jgi:PGF-pre-PGF domain-containing protein
LFLTISNNNNLSKNIVYNNGQQGIALDSSENNEISGNNVSSNTNGIYMCPRSYGNKAYDNYFNNNNNANIRNNQSSWYIEKALGKNVMGGRYIGGNFWGSPSDMGFSDNKSNPDGNEDGIIDIPFVSANGNITDNYPLKRVVLPVVNFNANPTRGFVPLTVEFTDLSQDATSISWDTNGDGISDNSNKTFVKVYETPGIYTVSLTASNKNGTAEPKTMQIIAEKFKVYPVADFSANPTSGYAPLSVQFTDLSQNAISRNWNFGDGAISTEPNPMHTYSTEGTYTVNLTANNENGTNPKLATITVNYKEVSSHSSGGVAGGSPEPAKNVQVKELSQAFITNGKPVKFDFAKNATCVVYVSFDSKKTAGKTTAIAEQLKNKSTLVSELNADEVYKYFNIWVGTGGFATSKNIENPVVCFKVEKSWMQDKKIDPNSITLNRYSDKKWSQLPVKYLNEDDKYLYFTAQTPEFSFFAITGKAVENEKVAETKPSTKTSKLEQNNTTVSQTEQKQKPEQKSDNGKITSIPGFEVLYGVACLITVFLNKRK